MIIDCIADPHGFYPKLEGGDLLIVAGDLTAKDTEKEYFNMFDWIYAQQYKKKILVAGNHDGLMQKESYNGPTEVMKDAFTYLCDSGTEFEGLKIWGSPWTKTFKGMNPKCKAFTVDTEEELAEKWGLIPDDTDIVITHGPMHGILDCVRNRELVGSPELRNHILGRIKPSLHVCGHIHEWGGKLVDLVTTRCVNASIVNERYEHVNKPVRVIL